MNGAGFCAEFYNPPLFYPNGLGKRFGSPMSGLGQNAEWITVRAMSAKRPKSDTPNAHSDF